MDTTTPSGELLFHVFGALAQYERALTKERVVAGLTAAKRRGRIGGRPPAIVGEKFEAITTALKTRHVQGRSLPKLWRKTYHPDRNPGSNRLAERSAMNEFLSC